jgi:hypothetical protein
MVMTARKDAEKMYVHRFPSMIHAFAERHINFPFLSPPSPFLPALSMPSRPWYSRAA